MKKALLTGIAALLLATGTAHAMDCDESDPNPDCDNPTGWIAQCDKGDKSACRASADLLEQVAKDDEKPFELRWRTTKWDCALEPIHYAEGEGDPNYPDPYIRRKDLPKIIKAFKEMKGHCAFLQCLDDRYRGKVKHCYENDKRWR